MLTTVMLKCFPSGRLRAAVRRNSLPSLNHPARRTLNKTNTHLRSSCSRVRVAFALKYSEAAQKKVWRKNSPAREKCPRRHRRWRRSQRRNRRMDECLTEGVLQVLLPHQLEVFLDGLGCQRVLPEDEVLVLATAIHLGHHQIREEVLRVERNDLLAGSRDAETSESC